MSSPNSQLPLLPTFSAITAGTPANPSSPVGFDLRVMRYHIQWAVPSAVVMVVLLYLAYRGYKYYKARQHLKPM